VHAIGHSGTIWHHLAGKWHYPKVAAILPLFRTQAANASRYAIAKLSGGGVGRCVSWVTLSRPDVGAGTQNAIPLQPLHAFKQDQA